MSISEREQTALDSIGNGLARSSPELMSMVTIFSRLTAGEAMPVRERVWRPVGDPGTGAAPAGPAGPGRTRRRRLSPVVRGWLWVLAAVMVLTLALALSRGTGKSACAASRTAACGQAPSYPPAPPGARRAGGL